MSIAENAYKTICCIRCGDEVGSGFLIAPDMVLTADHVILPFYESGESVKVTFENDATAIECSVMLPESGTARPIALLKLSRERDVSVDKISDEILKPDDTVSACGFFPSDTTRADSITLKCVRTYKMDENQNVSFKPMDERRDSFSGFSGAPIYMD